MSNLQQPHKRFQIVSNVLRRSHIEEACDRPNVIRYSGAVHDKDPDTATHGHALIQLLGPRSGEAVSRYFSVPVMVQPFVGRKGDTHSFARGVRYLTHEHPSQQELGKYLYPDSEIFTSAGYDFRADIDALVALEGQSWRPTVQRIKLDVMAGKLSAWDVRKRWPGVYVNHRAELHKLAVDYREAAEQEQYEQNMRDRSAGLDVTY